MNESISKTLAAIRALPENIVMAHCTAWTMDDHPMETNDLKTLADEYESMREMCEAAGEDSELWFGEKSVMKFYDGKWRTDGSTYFDGFGNRLYHQEGWDSPVEAFKALQPNPAPDGGRK